MRRVIDRSGAAKALHVVLPHSLVSWFGWCSQLPCFRPIIATPLCSHHAASWLSKTVDASAVSGSSAFLL
jgi:hypothetical protein